MRNEKDFFKWSFGLRFLFIFLCALMCIGNAWGATYYGKIKVTSETRYATGTTVDTENIGGLVNANSANTSYSGFFPSNEITNFKSGSEESVSPNATKTSTGNVSRYFAVLCYRGYKMDGVDGTTGFNSDYPKKGGSVKSKDSYLTWIDYWTCQFAVSTEHTPASNAKELTTKAIFRPNSNKKSITFQTTGIDGVSYSIHTNTLTSPTNKTPFVVTVGEAVDIYDNECLTIEYIKPETYSFVRYWVSTNGGVTKTSLSKATALSSTTTSAKDTINLYYRAKTALGATSFNNATSLTFGVEFEAPEYEIHFEKPAYSSYMYTHMRGESVVTSGTKSYDDEEAVTTISGVRPNDVIRLTYVLSSRGCTWTSFYSRTSSGGSKTTYGSVSGQPYRNWTDFTANLWMGTNFVLNTNHAITYLSNPDHGCYTAVGTDPDGFDYTSITPGESTITTYVGDEIALTAIPEYGYKFAQWYLEDGEQTKRAIPKGKDANNNPVAITARSVSIYIGDLIRQKGVWTLGVGIPFNQNYSLGVDFVARSNPFSVKYEEAAHGSYTAVGTDNYGSGAYPTITIGGAAVTTFSDDKVTLTATPASGYYFHRFYYIKNGVRSTLGDAFVASQQVYIPSGTTAVGAEFVENDAPFYVDGMFVGDLQTAIQAATAAWNIGKGEDAATIAVMHNTTITTGNYTIPEGVTLLIPYKEGQTTSLVIERVVTNANPTGAFRTLTLANGAHIKVYGKVEIGGCQTVGGTKMGHPGPQYYGQLHMNAGSSITLNDQATMYAWGFVTGAYHTNAAGELEYDSKIDVHRGATIYEQFQVMDWKDVEETVNICDFETAKKVLPVNQYFIQNIEVATVYRPGSRLLGAAAVNVTVLDGSSILSMNNAGIIGVRYSQAAKNADPDLEDDKAVFLLNNEDVSDDTWVCKYYDPSTDQQVYDINNSAYLGSLEMRVYIKGLSNLPGFDDDYVTADSRYYQLPITNNFKMHLLSGDFYITQNTEMLPGSVIEINKKSTMTIQPGQTLLFYDSDNWGKYVSSLNYTSGTNNFTWVYASRIKYRPDDTPTDEIRNISTAAALGDAQLIVHGTVKVDGYLKTTDGGASITSTNADAGTIIISNEFGTPMESADDKTYQVKKFSVTSDDAFAEIHRIPAKLLNGNNSFVPTTNKSRGTSFCYINDAWSELEEEGCFVKSGTDYYAKPKDYVKLLHGKTAEDDHTYKSADGTRTLILVDDCQWWEVEYIEENLYHCTHKLNDVYYYWDDSDPSTAKHHWAEKKYKVSWIDWNSAPINYTNINNQQVNYYMVKRGTVPEWLGDVPQRENNDYYSYEFDGWSPTPAAVTADITYQATYKATNRYYRIDFKDGNEILKTQYLKMEEMPTPPSIDMNGYSWKTADGLPISQVTGVDVTYLKTVNALAEGYTIAFVNWNGDILQSTDTTKSGNIPLYAGETPNKPSIGDEDYVFAGWTPAVVAATKDQVYTATFEKHAVTGLNVVDDEYIIDNREVTEVHIKTSGILEIETGKSLRAENLYLEATSNASGQILTDIGLNITGNFYFDLALNAVNHTWYGFAVPWQVDAESGISVNGRTLELGKDFDIIYYDGARRANEGKQKCWSYVENDGDKTLQPGRLYMLALMGDAPVIRFAKKEGAVLLTTSTEVEAHPSDVTTDANWNGVANPALFHAYVNAGSPAGQVYNPATKGYMPITMSDAKMVVGQGAFIQTPTTTTVTVTYGGAYAAPRRNRTSEMLDLRIAPIDKQYTDRLFLQMDEDKEEDTYIIAQDLVKVGVSSQVAQMWVNRYNAQLCMNTIAPTDGKAEYPLGISVPTTGEYTISLMPNEENTVYLTRDGQAIWNLSDGAYTMTLNTGKYTNYGIRVGANAPQVTTGIDEAVVDAKGETRKVLIDNQVFIIRGEQVYTIDGQLVK